MFTSKKVLMAFAAIAASTVMAACGTPATSAPVATVAPVATEAAAATTAPTEASSASTASTAAPTEAGATDAPTAAAAATEAPAATTAPAAATKVNLNTATADEILAIPNTGNRMVREFQEYRPYTSIVQFRREIGKYVGDAQVAEYEKYVYVPVSPNNADAATLQQLPGVTSAIADQIIAARPFASKDAFMTKLGELTSADQAASAAAYVEAE